MRTPNESKSPPVTPSQENQPPVPSQPTHPLDPTHRSQAPPIPTAPVAAATASSQPNNHNNQPANATNNVGKYDESILFQLQRAPASSAMSSIRSSSMMILAGTQSQHQKEDSLIDLNEESSYMKQSQPMPDKLKKQPPSGGPASEQIYMNTDQEQTPVNSAASYQRLPPLQVSDRPNQAENQISHQRIPSDSSILDEPIDVPTIPDPNDSFSDNFDDRTYANFPSNHEHYADQSFSAVDSSQMEAPLATSSQLHPPSSGNGNQDRNDSSFDSLPPGETYHLPPHEQSSSSSAGVFLQQSQEFINSQELQEEVTPTAEVIEEDPFDTSAIILPEDTVKDEAPSTASGLATGSGRQQTVVEAKTPRLPQMPSMLSQLEPFISPKEKISENNDDFRYAYQ